MKEEKRYKVLGIILALIAIFILLKVFLWDFEESIENAERRNTAVFMKDVAVQGTAIIEDRVDFSFSIMRNISELLKDEENMQSDRIMDYLRSVLENECFDVLRFGVSGKDGKSIVTNGKAVDISNREFFQEGLKGNEFVSGLQESKLEDKDIIFLSVPIFDVDNQVKGVLYGVIEPSSFEIYEDTKLNDDSSQIQIIDTTGEYVTSLKNRESFLEDGNFFQTLENKKSSVSVEEIKKQLKKGQAVYTTVKIDEKRVYFYITPLRINEWYTVTAINESVVNQKVHFVQETTVILTVKIILTIFIFVIVFFVVLLWEKRKMERMNEELSLRDNIFQVAVTEVDGFVFVYDTVRDQVHFMNNSDEKWGIPKSVEHASEMLLSYISPINKEVITEFTNQFYSDLKERKDKTEFRMMIYREDQVACYEIKITHFYDAKKKPYQSIGMIYDVTEANEKKILLKKETKLRSIAMSDVIYFYEIDIMQDKIVKDIENNQEMHYTYSDILAKFVQYGVAAEDQERVLEHCSIESMRESYRRGVNDFTVEYQRLQEDGSAYWAMNEIHLEEDSDTGALLAFMAVRDIDTKKKRELYLEKQAVFDTLTQIYNRNAGVRKINQKLDKLDEDISSIFMILDLDFFKQLNDTLGHVIGDKALIDVASILKKHFRSDDVVCRLGGDEFVVFLQRCPLDELDKIIGSLLRKLELHYEKDGLSADISASVGVSIAPIHGQTFDKLYEKADIALYNVKKTTRNTYAIYNE